MFNIKYGVSKKFFVDAHYKVEDVSLFVKYFDHKRVMDFFVKCFFSFY